MHCEKRWQHISTTLNVCLNMVKRFHVQRACFFLKNRPGCCEVSWFNASAWLRRHRKSHFHGLASLVFAPSTIRCLAGARSVTSWAKFTTESSFVGPAPTIKAAAGMTSAWKIPHMERWKMTCGFLCAEASPTVWQRKGGRGGGRGWALVVFLDFSSLYTVICQSCENTREAV